MWRQDGGLVLCGEGLHGLQQVQGQAVLGMVLWQDLDETAHQPAGLGQGHQGAAQLTGVLQHTGWRGFEMLIIMCSSVIVTEGALEVYHGLEPGAERGGQASQQLHGGLCLALAVQQGVAQPLAGQHQQLGAQHVSVLHLQHGLEGDRRTHSHFISTVLEAANGCGRLTSSARRSKPWL